MTDFRFWTVVADFVYWKVVADFVFCAKHECHPFSTCFLFVQLLSFSPSTR